MTWQLWSNSATPPDHLQQFACGQAEKILGPKLREKLEGAY